MFTNSAIFILRTVFELYIMVLILRVFLQVIGANYFNPVSQLVVKLTAPAVKPLRKLVPGFKGVDLGIILAIYLLEIIKVSLIIKLQVGAWAPITTALILGVRESFLQLAMLLFYMIILRIILSWIANPAMGAIQEVSYSVTEPVLAPVRRLIPPVSGFDLSPITVLFLIQLFMTML